MNIVWVDGEPMTELEAFLRRVLDRRFGHGESTEAEREAEREAGCKVGEGYEATETQGISEA